MRNSGVRDGQRSLFEPIPQALYQRKAWALGFVDIATWGVGLVVGTILRLGLELPGASGLVPIVAVTALAHVAAGLLLGNYRGRYQVGSFDEVGSLAATWSVAASVAASTNYALLGRPVPTTGLISGSFLALAGMGAARLVWRIYLNRMSRVDRLGRKRILVFGAGEGGRQIVRAMQSDPGSEYVAVGILDDEPVKAHRVIEGVPVVGSRANIAEQATALKAGALLVAIPSADGDVVAELANLGRASGLEVMVLPDTSSLMGSFAVGDDIQPIEEVDLLGRAEVEVDMLAISEYIAGKRVLVTGAGGSIGSELCRQLVQFGPARLMMLDRDESALHGVQLSIEGHGLLDSDDLIVADIRDRERLFDLFSEHRPEVVFHTAALKHLTLLERHPSEGIKTNVLGTRNLIDAAVCFEVERFVNISTDKAADPTSVLGTTKRLAECYTALVAKESGRNFVSVRFGNVLGSRGSVIPTFLAQIEQGGPITVTDAAVTRYFMTIPEAVRLVVQSGAIGMPGETMILDMGEPVKIIDLAERLISNYGPGTDIVFTGLRAGEKLHEILTSDAELSRSRVHPRINHTRVNPSDVEQVCEWMDLPGPAQAKSLLDEVDRIDLGGA